MQSTLDRSGRVVIPKAVRDDLRLTPHAGEELIIAKNGRPYARLGPFEKPLHRRPGLLAGEVGDAFFEPLPTEELDVWET